MMKIQVAGASIPTETDLMMHILGNLPSDYDTLVPNLRKDLNAGTLTIEQIRTDLNAHYKKIGKRKDDAEYEGTEQSMKSLVTQLKSLDEAEIAQVFKKVFKGNCHSCGKQGHKSSDCPNKKGGTKSRSKSFTFNGKCYGCGMIGHRKADCTHKSEKANQALDEEESDGSDEENEDELGFVACVQTRCHECEGSEDDGDEVYSLYGFDVEKPAATMPKKSLPGFFAEKPVVVESESEYLNEVYGIAGYLREQQSSREGLMHDSGSTALMFRPSGLPKWLPNPSPLIPNDKTLEDDHDDDSDDVRSWGGEEVYDDVHHMWGQGDPEEHDRDDSSFEYDSEMSDEMNAYEASVQARAFGIPVEDLYPQVWYPGGGFVSTRVEDLYPQDDDYWTDGSFTEETSVSSEQSLTSVHVTKLVEEVEDNASQESMEKDDGVVAMTMKKGLATAVLTQEQIFKHTPLSRESSIYWVHFQGIVRNSCVYVEYLNLPMYLIVAA